MASLVTLSNGLKIVSPATEVGGHTLNDNFTLLDAVIGSTQAKLTGEIGNVVYFNEDNAAVDSGIPLNALAFSASLTDLIPRLTSFEEGNLPIIDADGLLIDSGYGIANFAPVSHAHAASDITSGTLSDARLSANVPLKSAANTFTASQTINGNLTLSGSGNITQTYSHPTNGPWTWTYAADNTLTLTDAFGNSHLSMTRGLNPLSLLRGISVTAYLNQSLGMTVANTLNPNIQQSGTAGYSVLDISATHTSTGSGSKYLLRASAAGTVRMALDSSGNLTALTSIVCESVNTGSVYANSFEGDYGYFSSGISTDGDISANGVYSSLLYSYGALYANSGNFAVDGDSKVSIYHTGSSGAALKITTAESTTTPFSFYLASNGSTPAFSVGFPGSSGVDLNAYLGNLRFYSVGLTTMRTKVRIGGDNSNGDVLLTVRGPIGQTGNLTEWVQGSTATTVANVTDAGLIQARALTAKGTVSGTGTQELLRLEDSTGTALLKMGCAAGYTYIHTDSSSGAFWFNRNFGVSNNCGFSNLNSGGAVRFINSNDNLAISNNLDVNYLTFSATSTILGASSGAQTIVNLNPVITQTGSAGYTALKINPTHTATGNGTKNLLWAGTGGSQKAAIDYLGNMSITGGMYAQSYISTGYMYAGGASISGVLNLDDGGDGFITFDPTGGDILYAQNSGGDLAFRVGYDGSTSQASDCEIYNVGNGLILKSPNGSRWRMTVSNAGAAVFNSL